MIRKKLMFVKIVIFIFIFTSILSAVPKSQKATVWGCVAHRQHKLFGTVMADAGQLKGLSGKLPPGWRIVKGPQKPGKYYFDLGKFTLRFQGTSVVFQISRWDFLNSALQDGFSEEAVVRKFKELKKVQEIQFKEDVTMADARRQFEQLSRSQVEELLAEKRPNVDFSIGSKGAIVLETTTKKLMKLFIENYSNSGYITVMPVSDKESSPSDKKILAKILEFSWREDLDGDGLIDIKWNPISHIGSSSFEVLVNYCVALVEIYER